MPKFIDLNLIRINTAFYRMLLPVYPPELRSEFGEAMIGTFSEQLEARTSAAAVWLDVVFDLVRVALPYRLCAALVPAVTLVSSTLLFYLVLMGVSPHRHF